MVYEYYGWGALERVAGLQDGDYEFYYDSAGRVDSLSYPGGAWSRYTYDDDGRLRGRHTRSASDSLLQADTLTYDRRGKLVRGERLAGSDVTNVYTGLGHLAASEWWLASSWKLDEWAVNALEENYEARFSTYAEPALNYVYTYNGSGQLASRELSASDTLAATELVREYDHVGNMRFGYERQLDEYRDEVYGTGHRSLYGADEKLRYYHQYGVDPVMPSYA